MNSFAEKVVLVTGATRGIGRATTIAFAREGANVVFCGRHEEWGEETARLAREAGGEATFVRGCAHRGRGPSPGGPDGIRARAHRLRL